MAIVYQVYRSEDRAMVFANPLRSNSTCKETRLFEDEGSVSISVVCVPDDTADPLSHCKQKVKEHYPDLPISECHAR